MMGTRQLKKVPSFWCQLWCQLSVAFL